ncbi:MmgE/PrpD family protein [Chloroflexota bacterium]
MSKTKEVKLTEQFTKFITETNYQNLSVEAVATAKRSILDCVGLTIAGSLEPAGRLVANLVRKMGGNPEATVVGAGFRTSPCNAALANGTMAHALDYDDVSTTISRYPITTHLTSVILPVLLSLGEEVRASGRDIITAYVLGYEIASQLANTMGPDYGDNLGWHPTSPLGTVGASAAAAKLCKLNALQTGTALGIAASQAAGVRQNFGTMVKPFHAGNAARSGIISAMLAKEGFTAASDSLEGQYGFCHAFSGGRGYDVARIMGTLGEPFQVVSPGPAVKLYPCCGSTHGALEALFSLLQKYDIQADKVSAVEVSVPFDPPRSVIYDNPQNALEGKFSMQYCLGAALVDHKVRLETFTTEQVQRPEVRKLFDRISMFRQSGMEGRPSWELPDYVVTVKMDNGETYSEQAKAPFIAPIRIATWEELREKYQDCASLILSDNNVETSLELLENLEELQDITCLAEIIIQGKD